MRDAAATFGRRRYVARQGDGGYHFTRGMGAVCRLGVGTANCRAQHRGLRASAVQVAFGVGLDERRRSGMCSSYRSSPVGWQPALAASIPCQVVARSSADGRMCSVYRGLRGSHVVGAGHCERQVHVGSPVFRFDCAVQRQVSAVSSFDRLAAHLSHHGGRRWLPALTHEAVVTGGFWRR